MRDDFPCCVCKRRLPRASFYANAGRSPGVSSECRDCTKEMRRKYRAEHPDLIAKQKRRWLEANRQLHYEAKHRRRVRLMDGVVEKIDPDAIYKREGGRCHICGKMVTQKKATLDHLVPVSKGGDHVALNVRIAHRSCNSRRGPGRIPAQLLMH